MWLIVVLIMVGALAYRSATYIYGQVRGGYAPRLAVTFAHSPAREVLTFYVIAGLPLAFVNGFLLRFSWVDCVVIGAGTWLGTLAAIFVTRQFNPALQFVLFGGANVLALGANVITALFRVAR